MAQGSNSIERPGWWQIILKKLFLYEDVEGYMFVRS
jgi:hypothetical protein